MSTWTRTDQHGTRIRFTITPDQRGNVTLTREEAEGLLRTGRWTPEAEVGLAPDGDPTTPCSLGPCCLGDGHTRDCTL